VIQGTTMRSIPLLIAVCFSSSFATACVDITPVPVTACDGGPCDYGGSSPGGDDSAADGTGQDAHDTNADGGSE
jgi:hypothetical protein